MRTIIAGSRDFADYELLKKICVELGVDNDTIISGGARGADSLGERFAKELGLRLEIYKADWDRYGKSAGYKRNELMSSKAERAVIFWDGVSRGSKHMYDIAVRDGLKVALIKYKEF